MRAKVLLYRLDEESERGSRVRAVLREMKILALTVDETQLDETVGRLAALNAAPAEHPSVPESIPQEPFMLLCGLGGRQLDRLLAALRRADAVVDYRAVMTDSNRGWTLCQLMREVAREHNTINNSR